MPLALGARKHVLTLFALILTGQALAVGVARAEAAPPSDSLGVYRGSANPNGVGAFGAWVGARPGVAVDFLAKSSWSDISRPEWWADGWAGSGYDVVYSVPLLPDSGGTLQQGAEGAYNEHFRRLAQVLVSRGQGDAVLRLGWEMNGDWYRWSIKNGAAAFAAYWRQVVTTMRSVSPSFKFDFTVNQGSSTVDGKLLDPAAAYPGDAYVDFIGMDVYDQSWAPGYRDPRVRWESNLKLPYGLEWHRDFAAARGKPMTFPEWALTTRDDGYGGGDAPYFIERMYEWIRSNNVAYHAYFEFDAPDGRHELMNGQFPASAARFKQLFGEDGGPGPGAGPRPRSRSDRPARPRRRPLLRAKLLTGRVSASAAGPRVALRWRARGSGRVSVFHNGRRIARELPRGRRRLVATIQRRVRRRHYFKVCRTAAPRRCSKLAVVRLRAARGVRRG